MAYRRGVLAVQVLLWGDGHPAVRAGRIATIQSVGSSGGLKVGADFLHTWFPGSEIWVSDPTWDNHKAVFDGAGLKVHTYPYYDPATGGLKFDAMLATLQGLVGRPIDRESWLRDVTGLHVPLLVVHDRKDRVTSFAGSSSLVEHWPGARLMATEGLGHARILSEPSVIDAIVRFVGEPAGTAQQAA